MHHHRQQSSEPVAPQDGSDGSDSNGLVASFISIVAQLYQDNSQESSASATGALAVSA